MTILETNEYARALVWMMFGDAADEDYMIARQAVRMGAAYQFAWSAQQAIEKYLKCSLLLNDVDVSGFGHDLLPMFERVRELSDGIMPILWCPPREFPRKKEAFGDDFETYESIVARFSEAGHTDSRYRHTSLVFLGYDLHKFDELVFQLRRLAVPLDRRPLPNEKTYRSALVEDPSLQHSPIPSGFNTKNGEHHEAKMAALTWRNFSFFREIALEEGFLSNGTLAINSPIGAVGSIGGQGAEAVRWLVSQIRLRKREKAMISAWLPEASPEEP
ncbi:MAG: hypothetical protein CSA74_03895 [Rhodobacterales bacterium]|nr:MAG: hypothetical protein CSA74_03895 [Rhodobacterales bacterium]